MLQDSFYSPLWNKSAILPLQEYAILYDGWQRGQSDFVPWQDEAHALSHGWVSWQKLLSDLPLDRAGATPVGERNNV